MALDRLASLVRGELKALRAIVHRRLYIARGEEADAVVRFHRLYYDSHLFGSATWTDTRWLGVPVLKCPLDLWVYQEILWEVRPDLIVESGTAHGGSSLYLAGLCDLMGRGRILTLDIGEDPARPPHPRIEYVLASSVDPATVERVRTAAASAASVLVILDSDHGRDHVLAEMRLYGPLVTPGSYLIVEDTNLNGHPVDPAHGPGPGEAVEAFLPEHPEFEPDPRREKFYLTFNPKGYLRRK